MIWDREFAGFIINMMMIISFVSLLLKRKNLGEEILYFIMAIGLLTAIEIFNSFQLAVNPDFDSSTIYVIGINFFVFLLFLIYFQKLLYVGRSKIISRIIIGLFLLNYFLCAVYVENFFNQFYFFSYFVEIVLLIGSIYLVLSQTFNSDKILVLNTYFPFWVCISLLVTYLGLLPLLIINNTAEKTMNLEIFFSILFLVNFVGYLILIVGILKAKKENKIPA